MTDAPSLVIYSKDNCVQCTATHRDVEKHDIPHVTKTLTEADANMFKELGLLQAPVVVPNGDLTAAWTGYRPDRLKEYRPVAAAVA